MSSKFYLTSAIAYANAQPHLGHALEAVQADVLARYRRQHGDDTFFLTGMDEHGLKVQQTAAEMGKKPIELANEVSGFFENLYKELNISYDRFIRTTEADHLKAAAKMWESCKKDIYKHNYTGLYCVGCERYYRKEELLNDTTCPIHKTAVEELSEENYFFKLSNYTEKIKQLITSGELAVYPETRKNEILGLLNQGLEDISISRKREHLEWGVPVPGDDTQVMYVWFDALTNYLTGVGYGSDPKKFANYWPADMHVIGKDILRFHAAMWPAMLMSADLPLPKAIFVHGFISSEGHKMSKSLGNVINPGEVINSYGADALRYYLIREIPTGQDGDFSWDRFKTVYETDLANELGNLVQRVAVMIKRYQGGAIGEVPDRSHDASRYFESMNDLNFDKALQAVWDEVRGLNQYLEAEKPWELIKTDPEQLADVLTHAVSDLTQIATMILPIMPTTAEKITQTFAGGVVHPEVGILFPKLEETPRKEA